MTDTKWLDIRLDSVVKRMAGPVLYLVPTTSQVVSETLDLRATGSATVIAPFLHGCMDATSFLSALKARSTDELGPCISFPDQLVSDADAPIPVEHDGVRSYFPAIELIANRAYSFTLHVWVGERFREIRPAANIDETLGALRRHLRSCERLGAQWLAREAQRERSHAERTRQAHLRLRAFHSALMHASLGRLSPSHHRIATEVLATERSCKP